LSRPSHQDRGATDGRDKPGHDDVGYRSPAEMRTAVSRELALNNDLRRACAKREIGHLPEPTQVAPA